MTITFRPVLRLLVIFVVVNSLTSLDIIASPVATNSTSSLQMAFDREVAGFFLFHYGSLNSCAGSKVRNNSCPGNDNHWKAPQDKVQMKEMCNDFAVFSTCLHKSICMSCNTDTAVDAYCAKDQNEHSSAIFIICEVSDNSGLSVFAKIDLTGAIFFLTIITGFGVTLYMLIFK